MLHLKNAIIRLEQIGVYPGWYNGYSLRVIAEVLLDTAKSAYHSNSLRGFYGTDWAPGVCPGVSITLTPLIIWLSPSIT